MDEKKEKQMITNKIVADKLLAYMRHHLPLTELVSWAEQTLVTMNYSDDSSHTIRNTLAHLGLADVKAFGLEWSDCENLMENLGFKLEIKAMEMA